MKFFSIFSSKKRNLPSVVSDSDIKIENCKIIALRIKYIKYFLVLVLMLFIFTGLTFYSDALTMDNFKYMFKFMSIDLDTVISDGSTITFDVDEEAKPFFLNGDLAIVHSNGLMVCGMHGEKFLNVTQFYNDPLYAVSGSTFAICDRNGTTLDFYNVYIKVYTETFDYPIRELYASSSGDYAILTSSAGYRSSIRILDNNFRLKFYYNFADKYVFSIGISPDGQKATACTLTNDENGEFVCELNIFNTLNKKAVSSVKFSDEVPWKTVFRSDGSYCLFTDRYIHFFNNNDEEFAKVNISENSIKSIYTGYDTIAVVSTSAIGLINTLDVTFYDVNGIETGKLSFNGDVNDIKIIKNKAYIYCIDTLYTVDINTFEELRKDKVGTSYNTMVYDNVNDRIILIYKNGAVIYEEKTFTAQERGSLEYEYNT